MRPWRRVWKGDKFQKLKRWNCYSAKTIMASFLLPEVFEKKLRCTEALFVTGERPEQRYPQARSWLHSLGHSTTIEYIREMSENILQTTGLLPHTNAGSLTKKEMSLLKDTNVSMGVMLESSSERLTQKGMPHEMAPSKNPKVRIKTLEDAGDLRIPTTTGLLIGIGEEPRDII